MNAMHLTKLGTEHANAAAQLHMAGQPGTFLTRLGADVLTVFYCALPGSPVGFGFAACAPVNASSLAPPPLVGFVSATTSTARLFVDLGLRHWGSLLPPLLKRFVQQPALISASVQTLRYPLQHRSAQQVGGIQAELLSIMVEPNQRSQGIGTQLMAALLAECALRQISQLDVTVDANNEGAQRFYRRHGFQLAHKFQLFGRKMYRYICALR